MSTLEIDIEVPQLKKKTAGADKAPGSGTDTTGDKIKRNLDEKADPASGKEELPTGP